MKKIYLEAKLRINKIPPVVGSVKLLLPDNSFNDSERDVSNHKYSCTANITFHLILVQVCPLSEDHVSLTALLRWQKKRLIMTCDSL